MHGHRWMAAAIGVAAPLLARDGAEFGTVKVVQLDAGNRADSVDLSLDGATSGVVLAGGNRGDYDLDFGRSNDVLAGALVAAVAERSRDNSAQGDAMGAFFATSAHDRTTAGRYYLSLFNSPDAGEVNIDTSFGWFPFESFRGGLALNETNGGATTELIGSPGMELGEQWVDLGGGRYAVDLRALGADASRGVLLTHGAKNEDNFALSAANADGTFTVFVHDNGAQGQSYEADPASFVFVPAAGVGSDRIAAVARVNSDGVTRRKSAYSPA
ncbi:hypothetical protein HNR46_001293 [Haloferula luteola]|uniref:Uncharacterized protein n=1 Tax=Haloferula luteola TaxID=595692 RepID=A0A840VB79_9BACT|nr:hypothetical protein [Haloferula luteola]MBB5351059.1 hypothetical protein [Haloferula luteola]